MSDMERHVEAIDAEVARHTAATDDELREHQAATPGPTVAESTARMGVLDSSILLAQAKAKRALAIAGAITGAALLVALILLGLVLRDGSQSRDDSDRKIDVLNHQIDALIDQLDAARAVRTELDLCQSKFDAFVANAARESNVGETELVILVATVLPGDREAQIGHKVGDLRKAVAAYRQAGLNRSRWVDAGKPLPCPI